MTARQARSSAVGLYVTIYYVGGAAGAIVPGYAWTVAGWPGCVATVAAVVALVAASRSCSGATRLSAPRTR